MFKKKFFFTVFLLLTIQTTYAQIHVGMKYDINGYPFNGHFDPFTYTSENVLRVDIKPNLYGKGYFYVDEQSEKTEGLIKFRNDKLNFLESAESEVIRKITTGMVSSFVIGLDSFFVAEKYQFKNGYKYEPNFVKYITEFNGNTFVRHLFFDEINIANSTPILDTYMVKGNQEETWTNFYDNKDFKDKALKYFGHIPILKSRILTGEYGPDHVYIMIKMAEYIDKYQKKIPIYLNKYWKEVSSPNKATYYAKIDDFEENQWTWTYYQGDEKIFKIKFDELFPEKKIIEYTSYHSNGLKKKNVKYRSESMHDYATYDSTGQLMFEYRYMVLSYIDDTGGYRSLKKFQYNTVTDSLGNNILAALGQEKVLTEKSKNKEIKVRFESREVASSYWMMGTDSVFQITDPNDKFNLRKLQNKLNQMMFNKNIDELVSEHVEGTILLSLLIDMNGLVVGHELLNKLHPELDSFVEKFLNQKIYNAQYSLALKPYKKKFKRYYSEVVIPIVFNIKKKDGYSVKYN